VANGMKMGSLMNPSGGSLFVLGSFSGDWAVTNRQFWRFLSFGLLHGGLIHFAMIAYSLYQIGQLIESQISRTRMLALITVTQFFAAFGTFVWYTLVKGDPMTPTVGGSGWLYGLLGFGIAMFHQMGPGAKQMRDSLLRWALIWLVLGAMMPGINNAAHIGGLVAGLAFAYIPEPTVRNTGSVDKVWFRVGAFCTVLWCTTLFFMFKSLVHYWPELMTLQ
jgi:rhomboid protease GluP